MKPHSLFAFWAFAALLLFPCNERSECQTRVDISGRDIQITVHIDAAGLGQDKAAANRWAKEAEKIWNDAFNGPDNLYKGCMNLRLNVDVKPVAYGAKAEPGRHMIFPLNKILNPNIPNGEIVCETPQGGSANPYHADCNGYFDQVVQDPTNPQALAHEIGHLLDLQDEYTESFENGKRVTHPLPGREGTLMAEWKGRIDSRLIKTLVDRLRNFTHQIPDCKRAWQGMYEDFSDTTQKDITGSWRIFRRNSATFSMTTTEGNHFVGTAHLNLSYEEWDEEHFSSLPDNPSCSYHVPRIDLTWDAQLSGEYEDRPDGTTWLNVTASQGPSYRSKGRCYFQGSYPDLHEAVKVVDERARWMLTMIVSPYDEQKETPHNGPFLFGKTSFTLYVKEVKNKNVARLQWDADSREARESQLR
jgi:hypothetical protein